MKFLFPVLVALLTIFAIAPLGYPGGFQSHSGLLAVYNLIDLDQQPLQFFNWAPVIGRSFDFLRGDGALPYWFALLFHRGGVSYLDSIKLVYALAWIASGLAMFALAKNFFADAGALLAVTVYVYLPYHIVTVYVRGAFAESVAWALFPIAMLALTRPRTKDEGRKTFAFTLFTFAFLFLTQPGLAILFAFVASLLIFAINGRAQNFARTVAPPLAGIFLGALFSLPLLARYGISFPRDGFTASFVFPFQLFSALWGYGTSTGSFLDQFPFQLGVVPLGFAIATLAIKTRAANEANRARTIALIFLGAAVILSALTFEIAAPLWSILNFFVSAPWQLLALVGFALAFAAGAVTKLDAQLARFPMLA
ncbi:MAG: hypothetical protein HY257_02560, partial [Chloroflexi bacterium]|nr:hypothetical protein [Chloroflexota bacterium]